MHACRVSTTSPTVASPPWPICLAAWSTMTKTEQPLRAPETQHLMLCALAGRVPLTHRFVVPRSAKALHYMALASIARAGHDKFRGWAKCIPGAIRHYFYSLYTIYMLYTPAPGFRSVTPTRDIESLSIDLYISAPSLSSSAYDACQNV